MKVLLAGFNADIDNENKTKSPETISAAYARISRSAKSVDELRSEAAEDVRKARQSNQNIIFSLGHSSIAEHAVFNIDLIDVSRLSAEYIQHHRLASFTEKSQRYVKFSNNYLVPDDITGKKDREEYVEFCNRCFTLYKDMIDECDKINIDKYAAKEDARYVLPLSTLTQMGMTVNARTLEYMLSDLNSQHIIELSGIAGEIYKKVKGLCPSVIKYTDMRDINNKNRITANFKRTGECELIDSTENAEMKVAGYYLFEQEGVSHKKALASAKCGRRRRRIFEEIFKKMDVWDKPHRAFEHAVFTFNVNLSASAYAQLKRHRMANMSVQGYSVALKPVIPQTIEHIKYTAQYLDIAERSSVLTEKLFRKYNSAGYYAVINGMRRNVIITMNARELYHFIRLRGDEHAQWEIRQISDSMLKQVKSMYPDMFAMACGKHEFEERKRSIIGL